jgi:hypothetical protein
MFVINTYAIKKFLNLITLIFGDLFILIILVETLVDLPPINHSQSVRIKLLTIGETHEDPKTAVPPRI